jgi:hypothetical protein
MTITFKEIATDYLKSELILYTKQLHILNMIVVDRMMIKKRIFKRKKGSL